MKVAPAISRRRCAPMAKVLSGKVVATLLACRLASASQDKACFGFEEEFSLCKGLPKCVGCVPVDCAFNAWSDWSYFGGCTELCIRTRNIKHDNNDCGKACNGTERATKKCDPAAFNLPRSCDITNQSCTFDEWEAWFPATCEATAQQTRTRRIGSMPKGVNPIYCTGALKETRPCGPKPLPEDCILSQWSAWTACDATCGGGYSDRSRTIEKEAAHLGSCPPQALKELKPCNEQPCILSKDCIMGSWAKWAALEGTPVTQLSRNRQIITNAIGNGQRCDGALFEIKEISHPVVNCAFTQWQAWTACSKTCGTGQRSRSRSMFPWSGTGTCNVTAIDEEQGCNIQVCGDTCAFSPWAAWSTCSTQCGVGTKTRSRIISVPGFDCDDQLNEAAPCTAQGPGCTLTKDQDCIWGQWQEWGTCTATCGGGSTQRSRAVVVPAGKDATPCPSLHMAEVRPCGEIECNPCRNGTWKIWSAWTTCSSTCDQGLKSRTRSVETEANYCGVPATGKEAEYEVCSSGAPCIPDVDCELGAWNLWSACSPKCFGVTERSRLDIRKASGNGKRCTGSTKEILPCSPGINESIPDSCFPKDTKDCELGQWSAWSTCTTNCTGTQDRLRRIDQLPMRGRACKSQSMHEVQGCGSDCKPPDCKDCAWSAWGEWGMCAQCNGQRARSRFVQEFPNYCGKKCETRATEETQNCTGFCASIKYCVWEEWSVSQSCPRPSHANCGALTYGRVRNMKLVDTLKVNQTFISKGNSTLACNGKETSTARCKEWVPCNAQNCTAVNCAFTIWSEWSQPTCTGICERNRAIGTPAKCGGAQCKGVIVETKSCSSASCELPRDCQLSDWTFWSIDDDGCKGVDPSTQRYRKRTIVHKPEYGGMKCEDLELYGMGGLHETAGCFEQTPQDCLLAQWTPWGNCTKTCGSGTRKRTRGEKQSVEFQGDPCKGPKEEVGVCNVYQCPLSGRMECQWDEWTAWDSSTCGKTGMETRKRVHKLPRVNEQLNPDHPCVGDSVEMKPCLQSYSVPDLGPWSSCSKSCGGGQKWRKRKEIKPPGYVQDNIPQAALPQMAVLKEYAGCNEVPCDPNAHLNCSFTSWEAWTACSSTCGLGQMQRSRTHMTLRHKQGYGCTEHLMETRACNATQPCPEIVDCAWGDWAAWSTCNANCDGGEKTRVRTIQAAPLNGGKRCDPKTKEEAAACNTHRCKTDACSDGEWALWAEWDACSLSCNPGDGHVGLQQRGRGITVMPNYCGKPLIGVSKQLRSCNWDNYELCPSKNCSFGAWSAWTGCGGGTTCGGFQKRHRAILQAGSGPRGIDCVGATEETLGCKPCQAITPVDCEFSPWLTIGGVPEFGGCTASCGGGRKEKKRRIKVHAQHGGKPCAGALEETTSCGDKICPVLTPVDCKWGEWSKWSQCDECGPSGQRTRERSIATTPKNGGKNCTLGDSEQVTKCDTPCSKTFCTWGDWQAWGECNAKCGSAQKSRRRYLFSTDDSSKESPPKKDAFAVKYDELHASIENLKSSQLKDISIAFFLGGVAFLVAMSALRLTSFMRTRRHTNHTYHKMNSMDVSCGSESSPDVRSLVHRSHSRPDSLCQPARGGPSASAGLLVRGLAMPSGPIFIRGEQPFGAEEERVAGDEECLE